MIFVPQTYSANSRSPFPLTVWQSLAVNLVWFYVWVAFTPLMLWLGRRFPLERKKILRNLAILFLLQIPILIVHMRLHDIINVLLFDDVLSYKSLAPLKRLFVNIGAADIMIYWAVIGISQAQTFFRRYEERDFRLAQSQLQILKMQLHPHFLFNTLNAISELVYDSPEKADLTITQLSDLLRLSLKSGHEQEVPLKEELDFLQKYVEIQQTLLQERLAVQWDIAPETFDALVPNMILQPLVENSIRHGLAGRACGGQIEVKSCLSNNKLKLEVLDDGIGIQAEVRAASTKGVGITNARARLKYLYGDEQHFDLSRSPGGGLMICITIPFREVKGGTDEDPYIDS